MKIAIIGVGAMGSLFAAKLAPLADVIMLGNWPEQLAALQQQGISLTHVDGHTTQISVRATNDPKEIGTAGLALILVKSGQTERAAAQAAQVLPRDGLALTLQNGLGNLEKMVALLGSDRSALGVTAEGATMLGPGQVRHAGHGPTHLATTPATSGPLSQVEGLFRKAGLEVHLTKNVDSLVWGKLAINCGINPLTALLRVPNGFLAENPVARPVMELAARETAAVATALKIKLPYEDAAQRTLEVARATAANHSSMLQDISRGATTEIEAICGAVVKYGRRHQVATPVNQELLRLVREVEKGNRRVEIAGDSPISGLNSLLTSIHSGDNS